MSEVHQFEEAARAAEEDSEALRFARACVDKLKTGHASLSAGTAEAKAEPETLAARIRKGGLLQ